MIYIDNMILRNSDESHLNLSSWCLHSALKPNSLRIHVRLFLALQLYVYPDACDDLLFLVLRLLFHPQAAFFLVLLLLFEFETIIISYLLLADIQWILLLSISHFYQLDYISSWIKRHSCEFCICGFLGITLLSGCIVLVMSIFFSFFQKLLL